MIAVIADDFTGAAELAGIGLRYGLSVQLCTHEARSDQAELLVVSTNSRSLNLEDAVAVTIAALGRLIQYAPSFIYKKTDSVLRGHVLAELTIQMQMMGLHKALLLPANPTLGRTITNGVYYVNGIPVHESGFANDPEFSIQHSCVKEMLGAKNNKAVTVLPSSNEFSKKSGIIVGETTSITDMIKWASKAGKDLVLAGAGDFFEAILQQNHVKAGHNDVSILLSPHLYISGTIFFQSVQHIKSASCVHYLTANMIQRNDYTEWIAQVSYSLQTKQKAIIAIEPDISSFSNLTALHIRTGMAHAVKALLDQTPVGEMFIEGGATAAAILEQLGLTDFIPVNEISRGVIRMKAMDQDVFITVKPGSYQLPVEIAALYSITDNKRPS